MIGTRDLNFLNKNDSTMNELCHLAQNHLKGVYAMPSLKSLNVWHGIIFVRGGPYQNGIFRFVIFLQHESPGSQPVLKFTSPLFHPQVDPKSGILNLGVKFPPWDRSKNKIFQILKFMKSCFYNVQTWGGANKVAINVIHRNIEEFKHRAALCALDAVWLFDLETKVVTLKKNYDHDDTEDTDDDGNIFIQRNLPVSAFAEGKRMMLTGGIFCPWKLSGMS